MPFSPHQQFCSQRSKVRSSVPDRADVRCNTDIDRDVYFHIIPRSRPTLHQTCWQAGRQAGIFFADVGSHWLMQHTATRNSAALSWLDLL
jgi:hypothetical protein